MTSAPPSAVQLVPLIVADVYQLAGQFRAHGEAIAEAVRQTQARWQVMSAASAEPKTVPQIARRLGVSRQNVQRIADKLVGDGCARFVANPDHRASDHLILTERGHEALDRLSAVAKAYHVRIARNFSDVQLSALHRELRQMCIALERIEALAVDHQQGSRGAKRRPGRNPRVT